MSESAHIVVVDDEPDIRELLDDYLSHQGYRVTTACNAQEFRTLMDRESIDVVLLDVNMPGEDGFSLARSIRENSSMGILMVTSAIDVFDRVVGLEIGADDYVTKPFDLKEIAARISNLLRRMTQQSKSAQQAATGLVKIGSFLFDRTNACLRDQEDRVLDLSKSELALLGAFAAHPNQVLSRDELLNLAGEADTEAFDRSIDVRIARLRRKIESDPAKPQIIKTMRGAGYKLVT